MKINYIDNKNEKKSGAVLNMVRVPAGFGCDAFYMSETPVTEQQWVSVMGGNIEKGLNYPKVDVSFNDAALFCKKLSKETALFCKKLLKETGSDFRIPTELEFCRALGVEPDFIEKYAVFDREELVEVKTKLPNEYGLYDMRGLVWEWLDTKYENTENRPAGGGSWCYLRVYARAVCRLNLHPAIRNDSVGFRVVGCVRPPAL